MSSAFQPNSQAEINKLFSLQKQYALERDFNDLEVRKNSIARWNPRKVAERQIPFYAVFAGVLASSVAMYTVHRCLTVVALMAGVALYTGLMSKKVNGPLVVEALGIGFMCMYSLATGISMTVVFAILTALFYVGGRFALGSVFAERFKAQERSKQQSISLLTQQQANIQKQRAPLAQKNSNFDIFTGASRTPESVQDIIDVLASGRAYDIDSAVRAYNQDAQRINARRAEERQRIQQLNNQAESLHRMAFWNSLQLSSIEDELRRR